MTSPNDIPAEAGAFRSVRRRRGLAAVLIFGLPIFFVHSQVSGSPASERWAVFVESHPPVSRVPEDPRLGVLADLRNPDPAWSGAIDVCNRVLDALAAGNLPADEFLPLMDVPLTRDFEAVLATGSRRIGIRYALPVRNGTRVAIPVRVIVESDVRYGHIYLVRTDDRWYVEQWAVNISAADGG